MHGVLQVKTVQVMSLHEPKLGVKLLIPLFDILNYLEYNVKQKEVLYEQN